VLGGVQTGNNGRRCVGFSERTTKNTRRSKDIDPPNRGLSSEPKARALVVNYGNPDSNRTNPRPDTIWTHETEREETHNSATKPGIQTQLAGLSPPNRESEGLSGVRVRSESAHIGATGRGLRKFISRKTQT